MPGDKYGVIPAQFKDGGATVFVVSAFFF